MDGGNQSFSRDKMDVLFREYRNEKCVQRK